jgi:hypothetical protein
MVVGLLFGAETNIQTEISEQTEIANEYMYNLQQTSVVAPTIAPQYSIVHHPVLQFNSPSGSIGGSPITQTPAVTGTQVTPILTPSQIVEQGQQAELGQSSGGGIMDYILIIGVVVIGALIVLPMLLKKKVKGKVTTPAGIGGSVDT